MPAPLDFDLRVRIVNAVEDEGGTIEGTAVRYSVGTATVKRLLRLWRSTGTLAPKTPPGRPRKLDVAGRILFRDVVERENDLFQWQLAERLAEEYGLQISPATVGREISRAGITRKKNRAGR